MSNFAALIATIQANIKTNGNEEITGAVLQDVLEAMVQTLGTEAINNLETALGDEETARRNNDGTLQDNIDAEARRAGMAEAGLDGRLDTIEDAIENGYVYAGIATPSGTPVTGKVFYLALTAGTYTNFGGLTVTQGINILKYNGTAWSQEQLIGIDDVPTADSNNLVKSGGVQNELVLGAVYDVSAKNPTAGPNNDGKWESLSALLSDANLNTLIPTSVRKGGMSIKFVQSSDNKYVQYRLMSSGFTTSVSSWQGVDSEPISGSENLIKSSGVYSKFLSVKNNHFTNVGFIELNGVINKSQTPMYWVNTGLIQFDRTQRVFFKGDSDNQYINVLAFYDENKNFISGISNVDPSDQEIEHTIEPEDIPSNALYFAVCARITDNLAYVGYHAFEIPKRQIDEIEENLDKIEYDEIPCIVGYNVSDTNNKFNPSNVSSDNKYINPNTGLETDGQASYPSFISNYIDVSYFKQIRMEMSQGTFQSVYGYAFYDKNNNIISYGPLISSAENILNKTTLLKKVKYFRFSASRASIDYISVFVTKIEITKTLNELALISLNPKHMSYPKVVLSQNEGNTIITETLSNYDWQMSMTLVIDSISSYIRVQKGTTNRYGKSFIDIYPNEIVETIESNNRSKVHQLGFTLGKTFSIVLTSENGKVHVTILSGAGNFESDLQYFDGTNNIRVTNNCSSTLYVYNTQINYTKGFGYKICLCGDSYAYERWGSQDGSDYNYSWTTNLKRNGCKFENIGFPGATSIDIYPMLQYYINYASPNIIIWGMGMNDTSDNGNTPDPTWLEKITQAKELADFINATFIPCTIPSVQTHNNQGKNIYIKENFDRYINFEECLTDNGIWKDGYLANDGVHPTALGFAAMISQALIDVPEFNY